MANDRIYEVPGIEYQFTRRRYSNRTYTWLYYRPAGSGPCNWTSYGDPWPVVRISEKELEEALEEIRKRLRGCLLPEGKQ